MNPTTNPIEDPRKVTVRTVLRRPPIRVQNPIRSELNTSPKTTTHRSETPWTPINSTVATQRRTRVKIKDSLLGTFSNTTSVKTIFDHKQLNYNYFSQ